MNTDGMNNNDNEFNERNESPFHLSLILLDRNYYNYFIFLRPLRSQFSPPLGEVGRGLLLVTL